MQAVANGLSEQDALVISCYQDASGAVHKDVLWSSRTFFFKAMTCLDFSQEVETIIHDVVELPLLHNNTSTLLEVLRVMTSSHMHVIGLV